MILIGPASRRRAPRVEAGDPAKMLIFYHFCEKYQILYNKGI